MNSPQQPTRGSPPRRAALHERTDSQTNERSIRIVEDPQAPIYGTPFPTKPSQILTPKGYPPLTVGAEPRVSNDGNNRHETTSHGGHSETLATSEGRRKSPGTIYVDDNSYTGQPEADASIQPPQPITPSLGSDTTIALDTLSEDGGRMSDDIVQLPSVLSRSEVPGQHGQYSSDRLERPFVQEKDSESSLSSSNSTGTMIVKKVRDGKKRASYSAFPAVTPRSSSSRSASNQVTPQKSAVIDSTEQQSPVSPASPNSPVSGPFAPSTERRSASSPVYGNLQTASQSSVNLQYPVIRPPSASASWAESPSPTPERPQRTLDRNHDRWNPHLSTVQSEGTGSLSEGRSSQSIRLVDSTRMSKSSSMALHGRRSSDVLRTSVLLEANPDDPGLPIPPPAQHRDLTGSTIRVVSEQGDHVPALQPIPGSRDSAHLAPPSSSGDHRNSFVTKRGSNMSFFRDSIPAWAKAYYARPQSSSSLPKTSHGSRPSTSTDNISLSMFRPRTRNNQETSGQPRRGSLAIGPVRPRAPDAEVPDLVEIRGPPRRRVSPNWSPHLWHDRTSLGRRRTIFQAPSIDEQAEGKSMNKRNAQIGLFVIGFIFPFGWFIGSFLPLPRRPKISSLKGKDNPNRTQLIEDLEKRLDPVDEARYENARWWRNINRIMSLIGIVIIVAVIAIAAASAA